MIRTDYCLLDAPHDELNGRVDVDRLLEDVARAMKADAGAVETAYAQTPLRIMVRPGHEIRDLVQRMHGACDGEAMGLCLTPTLILVVRLDWKGLLAHEMTHAIDRLLEQFPQESTALRVADLIG